MTKSTNPNEQIQYLEKVAEHTTNYFTNLIDDISNKKGNRDVARVKFLGPSGTNRDVQGLPAGLKIYNASDQKRWLNKHRGLYEKKRSELLEKGKAQYPNLSDQELEQFLIQSGSEYARPFQDVLDEAKYYGNMVMSTQSSANPINEWREMRGMSAELLRGELHDKFKFFERYDKSKSQGLSANEVWDDIINGINTSINKDKDAIKNVATDTDEYKDTMRTIERKERRVR